MLRRRIRVVAGMALAAVRSLRAKLREERATDRLLRGARAQVAAHAGDLEGKRVLITGSTRGIGRALAHAFVEQGALVAVHGRRERDAREVARQLEKSLSEPRLGPRVVGLGADLSDRGAGGRLVEEAIAALGGVDLVINNAGVHDPTLKPIWETAGDEISAVMRVNVLATFEVCSAAVAHMVRHGVAGRIINMSTMAARTDEVSSGGIASYGISKIALEGLAHYLAAEAEPHGITVTTVRPGMIDTAMVAPFFPLDKRLRMLPPDSLVPPVVYLATAPTEDVHGRMFDQQELMELLAGAA